ANALRSAKKPDGTRVFTDAEIEARWSDTTPGSAPDGDNRGGGECLVDGGGDDRASEDEDCQDRGETSNSQEGIQGSHDGHSRVLRGTLCRQNGAAIAAFLRAYT